MKSTMKSWFSLMKSSVRPRALRSSPKFSRQFGSKASSTANSELPPLNPFTLPTESRVWWPGPTLVRGDSGGVGAEECLTPKTPSRDRLWPPPLAGAGPPNGVAFVARLAFFSRSFIFLRNCLASLSSTKDSPATQSSSSNVWKNMRSWL